ncbi:MAG: NnrU family protein [Paracoccaceae bacterium]
MTLLILGLALWWAAHLFKRLAPGARAQLGGAGKGLVAIAILASVVLMVLGFRAAEFVPLWEPPRFLIHVNNLLMFLAFFFYAADGMRAGFVARMRHPQLTGFKTWAVAHLIVNGDLAGVILFGGLLAWAVVTVIVINRSQPEWTPKTPKPGAMPKALAATVVVVVVVMAIHNWLGVQPWGG